jgi:hypothetical protein
MTPHSHARSRRLAITPHRRRARPEAPPLCLLVLALERAADLARCCAVQCHDHRLVELALLLRALEGDTAELADRILEGGAR